MFEISKIKKHAADLVAESSKANPDFNKARIYLNDLADEVFKAGLNVQAMKSDLYQLKNFCAGLNKSLLELEVLKGEEFTEIKEKTTSVLILTRALEKDPKKAFEEYGELNTIKAGLVANLGRLRTALKNAAAREEMMARGKRF